MKTDVREKTCLIIRRGPEYLVGTVLYSRELRWSRSPWDAWKTRNWKRAEQAARYTGGDLWLFNPILGVAREVRHGYGHEN